MKEEDLEELDPRLGKQVDDARKALSGGGAAYAIDVCMAILQSHPGCLEVRQVLREAQHKAWGKRKGLTRWLRGVSSVPFSMAGRALVQRDPEKALELAEKILNKDPNNEVGHSLLVQAAQAGGLPKTAVFALETFCRLEPARRKLWLELGQAYLAAGQSDEAVRLCERLLENDPACQEARDLLKRASVSGAMGKNGLTAENPSSAPLPPVTDGESQVESGG